MKEIKAIIQPFKLDTVIQALRQHPDLPGVTVSEVLGFGRERAEIAPSELRQTLGRFGYARRIKLEIVVADDAVARVRQVICASAHTGNPGDGLVFVSTVESTSRIRDEPGQPSP